MGEHPFQIEFNQNFRCCFAEMTIQCCFRTQPTALSAQVCFHRQVSMYRASASPSSISDGKGL